MGTCGPSWRLCRLFLSKTRASTCGSLSGQLNRCLSSGGASTSGRGLDSSIDYDSLAYDVMLRPFVSSLPATRAAGPIAQLVTSVASWCGALAGVSFNNVHHNQEHRTQQLLQQTRTFAAAAKGGAKVAAAASPTPTKKRRSSTRLFSCRNARFRNGFEQIWPTVRLNYDQVQQFRRNSRIFVIDMGKAITLRGKYRLATSPGGGGPVPYQQGQVMIHESDIHLDAVGEHPRYLKIRRLNRQYAAKLQNVRKIRLLLGLCRRGYLQNLYESSLLQKGPHRTWKLICAIESHLSIFALRSGFAPDALAMKGLLRGCHRFALNGAPPRYQNGTIVQPGDVLSPAPGKERFFRSYIARGLRRTLYPDPPLSPSFQSVYGAF